jgi:Tfp pilus assembly protein PilO
MSLRRRTNPRTVVLILLLSAVALGGSAWLTTTYRPARATIAELTDREAGLRSTVTRTRKLLGQMGIDQIRGEIRRLEQQQERLGAMLPNEANAAPLDPVISQLERYYGVTITLSTPLPDSSVGNFVVRRTQYAVRGPYHDVGGFLAGVLSLDRLVQVHDFALSVPPLRLTDLDRLGTGRTIEASFVLANVLRRGVGQADPPSVTSPSSAAGRGGL